MFQLAWLFKKQSFFYSNIEKLVRNIPVHFLNWYDLIYLMAFMSHEMST